jgi:hypothetical protein
VKRKEIKKFLPFQRRFDVWFGEGSHQSQSQDGFLELVLELVLSWQSPFEVSFF